MAIARSAMAYFVPEGGPLAESRCDAYVGDPKFDLKGCDISLECLGGFIRAISVV